MSSVRSRASSTTSTGSRCLTSTDTSQPLAEALAEARHQIVLARSLSRPPRASLLPIQHAIEHEMKDERKGRRERRSSIKNTKGCVSLPSEESSRGDEEVLMDEGKQRPMEDGNVERSESEAHTSSDIVVLDELEGQEMVGDNTSVDGGATSLVRVEVPEAEVLVAEPDFTDISALPEATSPLPSIRRLQLSAPAHEFPDPSGEFLRTILAENDLYGEPENGDVFDDERTLGDKYNRFRFSLVFRDLHQHGTPEPEAFEEFEIRRHQAFAVADNPDGAEKHAEMMAWLMETARRDGLDVREGNVLMSLWREFWLTHGHLDCYYSPPSQRLAQSLSPAALMFWVALRRGWGGWSPSSSMLSNFTRYSGLKSGIQHTKESRRHGSCLQGGRGLQGRGVDLLDGIWASGLPRCERARLSDLLLSLLTNDWKRDWRMNVTFDNWVALRPFMERSRAAEEAHFSEKQLYCDRLERMMREESVINSRMVLPSRVNSPEDLQFLCDVRDSRQFPARKE
ncbi:uncharacterized protein L3040_007113 [Drepanopeziza brunnea f. sp. 'multigermtubi']|uniref:Uncharacterized protein n=1 Tax=Marssonina brunnea f. sp. multigermtubi (strain MB_m1) TaxID=1072389 RepID=K1WJK0_MARBU|nr:uncharacterized protein MBM_08793 [Drepanopeziza brunnea f. sp. 'multigermtubi' MB_m1]EKD13031.1 hypothetical protein MBM_08793 [Drepanopeziza brunnea f. sp. 'multigermtubi' MB_m1]KAJ5038246.1 hypothetical protein L3040_007113 [Drepanopeziza brunnea f. sp. 'multigermtubi']